DDWHERGVAEDEVVQGDLTNPIPLEINQAAIAEIRGFMTRNVNKLDPEAQARLERAINRIATLAKPRFQCVHLNVKSQTIDVPLPPGFAGAQNPKLRVWSDDDSVVKAVHPVILVGNEP